MNAGPPVCTGGPITIARALEKACRGGSVLLEGELGVDLDRDLVADHDTAAVHRHVEVHAELLAADLSGRVEAGALQAVRSEEHTSELQSREKLVCRLLLAKKKIK